LNLVRLSAARRAVVDSRVPRTVLPFRVVELFFFFFSVFKALTEEADDASQQGVEVAAVCGDDGPLLGSLGLGEEGAQLADDYLRPREKKNRTGG